MKPKILLIAPHKNIVAPFRTALEKHGFAVTVTDSSSSRSRAPHTEHYALVVTLQQNGRHETSDAAIGSDLIDAAFLSPNRAVPGSIQLFQNGVYRLGADGADVEKFVNTVKELFWEHHASCQRGQRQASSDQQPATSDQQPDLIGQSPKIEEVRQLIKRISQFPDLHDLHVLITGETGTGKEVVARLLRACSPRADKPFVPVNCGAIPEALFESQVFGHCKGAFTGATADHPGYVGQAQGGTLFLDEISTLTLAQQVKLLRFLQDGCYIPVGEAQERQSDVTVVAATNEDLKTLVAAGRFREDLYARLKVIEINLPPLRERREDILPLAQNFLAKYAAVHNVPQKTLSEPAIDILQRYHWPQNVRELENLMLALTVTVTDDLILPEHLPAEFIGMKNVATREEIRIASLDDMEKAHIMLALQATNFNVSQSADLLQINRRTLQRKLKHHNIEVAGLRSS